MKTSLNIILEHHHATQTYIDYARHQVIKHTDDESGIHICLFYTSKAQISVDQDTNTPLRRPFQNISHYINRLAIAM